MLALLLALISPAAAACATVSFDGGDNNIIVGEWYYPVTLPGPITTYLPSNQMGICWVDQVGVSHLIGAGSCGGSTPAGDIVVLEALAGDDWVGVLQAAHVAPALGMTCTGSPEADGILGPWPSDFDFGLYALLGTGSDVFVGTSNNDFAFSNDWSPVAEGEPDLLCGEAGDDWLFGDADDTWIGIEEFMDGGPGHDPCWGDFNSGGSSHIDVSSTCEDSREAWAGVTAGPWSPAVMCDGVDDPVSEWLPREWRTF